MRIAVPSKGRLREPSIQLLHDAGLGPETPGDRALAFPCRNAPVEALLVRADDIPEYVQDGVVDCGNDGELLYQRVSMVTRWHQRSPDTGRPETTRSCSRRSRR